ncbi:MAG: translation initiation factor [Myxococcales bacterium]|nr:translation initiation factor [Myxococcales bacterium]
MAKRPPKAAPPSPQAPFHNPFAALDGLRGGLPVATLDSEDAVAPAAGPDPAHGAPPKLGKLVLQREKKGRGGKTVTRVRGLPVGELERWAGELKRALGCGATVEEGEVVLLGDLVGRAADWLETRGATRVVRGN